MIESKEEFSRIVDGLKFTFAKTRAHRNPHEYIFATGGSKLELVRELNKFLQENCDIETKWFDGKVYKMMFVNGHKYWSMSEWETSNILNRNWDKLNEDGTIDTSETDRRKIV